MKQEPSVWLNAALQTLRDSVSIFGVENFELVTVADKLPTNSKGAYIAVVGSQESVELGFASSASGHASLAQKFLGADEPLPEDDTVDAMREVANILAGALKGAMVAHDPSLALGLPMFVDSVHVGASTRVQVAHIQLCGEDVHLIVILRS